MWPTVRTFGSMLSPGFVSHHFSIGIVSFHAASERSPSMTIGPVAFEIVMGYGGSWESAAHEAPHKSPRTAAAADAVPLTMSATTLRRGESYRSFLPSTRRAGRRQD